MYDQLADLLQQNVLCKDWPEQACTDLAHKCQLRTVKKDTPLFAQGQPATHFYLLSAGQVRMGLRTQTGCERVICELEGPTSFGEIYMLMQNNYPLDAYALTDCEIAVVSFTTFVGVLSAHEHALEKVLGLLAKRLFALTGDLSMETQSFMSGTQRVMMYLLSHLPLRNGASCELKKPKASVAHLLNLTPEHFSRILHDLSKRGFINVRGRQLTLVDVDGLCAYER